MRRVGGCIFGITSGAALGMSLDAGGQKREAQCRRESSKSAGPAGSMPRAQGRVMLRMVFEETRCYCARYKQRRYTFNELAITMYSSSQYPIARLKLFVAHMLANSRYLLLYTSNCNTSRMETVTECGAAITNSTKAGPHMAGFSIQPKGGSRVRPMNDTPRLPFSAGGRNFLVFCPPSLRTCGLEICVFSNKRHHHPT